ncbi:hypothetical protein IIA79_08585 [bacterium]|nr:hypothetical protein [bacterium]
MRNARRNIRPVSLSLQPSSFILSLLMFALSSCIARQQPEPFTIVWNYDTSGYLETCGCSTHQLGGLARRATMIEQLRVSQPVLAIEGAHIVQEAGEWQLFKGETIVRSLNAMGYDAMMLGVREAQHGADGIARLTTLADFDCFSANLMVDGEPYSPASALVNIAGSTVGITGVSQPEAVSFELPQGMGFSDPVAGLEAALGKLEQKADLVVLCLEGESTWIDGMVQRFSNRAGLFLTGDRTGSTAGLEFGGDPPRLNNWKLGKYLGMLTVDPAPVGYVFTGANLPLDDAIADSPLLKEMLENDFRSQLKDRFFSAVKVDLEQQYLPPNSCMPCHAGAYKVYAASGHARALSSLSQANQAYNPDCMACHVVYDAELDQLHPLNCIVCHANITQQHLWDAVNAAETGSTLVVEPDSAAASYTYQWCSQCHDEENSHRFKEDWRQMAQQIFHGGKPPEGR